jgi:hypothetical protein
MVRGKNITRVGSKVLLEVILEDCRIPIKMVFDVNNGEFEPFVFPVGYEYCTEHIAKMKRYIKNALKNNEKLPKEKTIMWY